MHPAIYFFILTFGLAIIPSTQSQNPPVISKSVVVWHIGPAYQIRIVGRNFYKGFEVLVTNHSSSCPDSNVYQPNVLDSSTGYLIHSQPTPDNSLYLCVRWGDNWIHQGIGSIVSFKTPSRSVKESTDEAPGSGLLTRESRSVHQARRDIVDHPVIVFGMRMESAEAVMEEDGLVSLLSHSTVRVRLFGQYLTPHTMLSFTSKKEVVDGVCEFPSSDIFMPMEDTVLNHSAVFEVEVPGRSSKSDLYYLCIKYNKSSSAKWHHQGDFQYLHFRVYDKLLPVWASAIVIILLLCCSALFSGLTLGLMSLDKTDLKILCNTGTELERKYAAAIMPVRSHGSLLLCSLLLGNVLVNSVLTILMDDLTSGVIAVIFSTLTIVIFGEIMPQAICSRHGLAVGAKTIYITRFVIFITGLIAWPISKVLDYMLGEEIGNVYNRERLNELVKTGTDIEKDEVNIISGALQLSKKTVVSVMTKLEDVYMLNYDAILDFETVSELMSSGYSRIPVYDGKRSNIITLLFIKDLAFVDPDDNTPLRTLCEFYQNACFFVFEDMTLDVLFKKFKDGAHGHMAFVQRVNSEGEGDPFYETLGLITLEDVIEELIQAEIVDETDVWTDNRSKRKREKIAKSKDFTAFAEKHHHQRIQISPQLTLATFQYLSTTVPPFKAPTISNNILQRMLQQDVYRHIKSKNKDKEVVYHIGRPVDYFVLILEGRVEVLVGKENMKFESGPFTYFGVQALLPSTPVGAGESPTSVPASITGSLQSVTTPVACTFTPDYTVKPITELFYVVIKRSLYFAACRATRLELSRKAGDHFDEEVEKLLHIDDDERSQAGSLNSRRASQCGKESPLNNEFCMGGDGTNGVLPTKHSSEVCDPEERTTLLDISGS